MLGGGEKGVQLGRVKDARLFLGRVRNLCVLHDEPAGRPGLERAFERIRCRIIQPHLRALLVEECVQHVARGGRASGQSVCLFDGGEPKLRANVPLVTGMCLENLHVQ